MKRDTNTYWQHGTTYPAQHSEPVQPVLLHNTNDVFIPPHIENDPLDADTASQEQVRKPARPASTQMKRKRRSMSHKRRRQMRRRQRRVTAIGAVLGVFIIWLVLRFAPVPFGSIAVDGNETMSVDDVYHSSGVYSYVNVVQLSPDDIQQRLAGDLRIAEVTVRREFPATIRISITERKPAVVIATMYGFAYVDKDGVVMDIQPRIEGISVPMLTGKRMDTLLLGEEIKDPAVCASLIYLQHLSPEVAARVAEINVGNNDNIIAYTSDSLPVHLGTGDNPAERADITAELLEQIREYHMDVRYIDTNVQAPLVKEK